MSDALERRVCGLARLWDLEGDWDLSRVIRHGDGREDRFAGRAVFARANGGLVLTERGQLSVGGQSFEAEQRTLWAEGDGALEVSFADGRAFHAVTLGEPAPTAVHLCDPDHYEVTYDFADWPLWRAIWRVTGPRKDYVMRSEYRRAGD